MLKKHDPTFGFTIIGCHTKQNIRKIHCLVACEEELKGPS